MRQAREDGKPLVYIGFGSITVPNPQSMTEHIFQAVQKSKCFLEFVESRRKLTYVVFAGALGGVRAIVSRGWSSRMSKKTVQEVDVPKECYMVSNEGLAKC